MQSAYVRVDYNLKEGPRPMVFWQTFFSMKSPSGSSSGSAVAVSTSYVPFSVSTDTDRLLVALILPRRLLIPECHTMDAAGPLAKTASGLATLMDVMRNDPGKTGQDSYTSAVGHTWSGLSIGVLGYTICMFHVLFLQRGETATAQIVCHMPLWYGQSR